ncbi:MAG: class I SAM-dependent methyltransferase [Bacteroidetes bacterium]|nr:class I SAM-dependent methyltransferase [Bacteroidota bacterium]
MEKEWFRNWFNSDQYLEVYQHRDYQDATKLLDLIFRNVSLKKNSLILDAACGAGRHLIDLTAKGYNPFGFDLSISLLKKGKTDAEEKSIRLNLFRADLRHVALRQKFDLVLNLFTSFGYFHTDSENFSFAQTAFGFLNEGGIYVFDYLNEKYLLKNLIPESKREIEGKAIIERRKIAEGRVEKEIIINNHNSENRFVESVQLYSKKKIVDEFEKIGFKLTSDFGDYDGAGFDEENSKRLILFFKK